MSTVALTVTLAGTSQDIFVTSGWLRQRQAGPWTALLESSNADAPAPGSAAIVTFASSIGVVTTFVGTVRRARANPGSEVLAVSVVAGAGRLTALLPALDHVYGGTTVPAGIVARAICDAAGEQLAPGIEAALDAFALPRWHRAAGPGAGALDLLADYLGMPWRVLSSGLVSIASETWPPNDNGAYWMDEDEDDGGVFYAPDGAPLQVGQSIDGVHAIDVRYEFGDAEVTCEIRGAVLGDPGHRPDRSLYELSWPANVVAQNADGTIDVTCDDARMGDLRSLQVRVGLPGARVTLDMAVPNRVVVRFDGASPAGAFAESAAQDATASLPVALASGFLVAHVTDGGFAGLYYSATAAPSAAWVVVPSGPLPPTSLTSGLAITVPSAQVRLR